ncbi:MAG: hypothetical protein J7K29_06370 [Candidatus Cloacimonetes bacterium]|nr:hypothetical protein [Candidatus Cloacimonadota bacterium]
MITIKNNSEIAKMRESNRIVGLLLHKLDEIIISGISTYDINKFAEELIRNEAELLTEY